MLKKIVMKSGPSQSQPHLEVELAPLTVFVGPNNGGKSLALREIEQWVINPNMENGKVIECVDVIPFEDNEAEALLEQLDDDGVEKSMLSQGEICLQKLQKHVRLYKPLLFIALATVRNTGIQDCDVSQKIHYCSFLSLLTASLNGESRLSLANEQESGDLQKAPINHIAHLYVRDSNRERLCEIVKEAFSQYLVIDPTNPGKFRFRLSSEPARNGEEFSLKTDAREFHAKAQLVEEASDGVKAFIVKLTPV